ncbi:hypothetical protein AAFF_G00263040 [Aldrovandia affinis]|uniref:Uncharacterized protein n=1 Tax=Aldrovandia affinis TaxID=143900 RepID=A0AAD7SSW1_9TELE|nr:hypothetical protein AAFF_G00263040 [Aldrovandia affinis]
MTLAPRLTSVFVTGASACDTSRSEAGMAHASLSPFKAGFWRLCRAAAGLPRRQGPAYAAGERATVTAGPSGFHLSRRGVEAAATPGHGPASPPLLPRLVDRSNGVVLTGPVFVRPLFGVRAVVGGHPVLHPPAGPPTAGRAGTSALLCRELWHRADWPGMRREGGGVQSH